MSTRETRGSDLFNQFFAEKKDSPDAKPSNVKQNRSPQQARNQNNQQPSKPQPNRKQQNQNQNGQKQSESQKNKQEQKVATSQEQPEAKEAQQKLPAKSTIPGKDIAPDNEPPFQSEIKACEAITRILEKLLTPKNKKKQSQNSSEKASSDPSDQKTEEEVPEESEPFPNHYFDYDAIIKFELLSVAIPKSKEEAVALKQVLKERKDYFNAMAKLKQVA